MDSDYKDRSLRSRLGLDSEHRDKTLSSMKGLARQSIQRQVIKEASRGTLFEQLLDYPMQTTAVPCIPQQTAPSETH